MLALSTRLTLAALGAAGWLPLSDLFVDQSAASCGSGDGSAGSPVCTLAEAIALAAAGDTIHVAPGVYDENLVLPFDLILTGTSGAGVTTVRGGNAGSVFTIPAGVSATIDGLTITEGVAPFGGGIHLEGSLVLTSSTITGNSTTGSSGPGQQGGGGIGSPFTGFSPSLRLVDSTVTDNQAYAPSFATGGGVFLGGTGELRVERSRIEDNTCGSGTAVACGGGIGASAGMVINLLDSSLVGNESQFYGGGIYLPDGELRIASSTLSGNTSTVGGAIYATYSAPELRNTTISDNSATSGAAVWLALLEPGASFSHVTLTRNTGNSALVLPSYGDPVRFSNCVIAGNVTSNAAITGTAIDSLGHNFVETSGTGFVDGVNGDVVTSDDPLLGPLADNGGPTETCLPLAGSPLVDAADPVLFEALDQRGGSRPAGAGPDIGAVEVGAAPAERCLGDGGDQLGCTACPCGNEAPPGTLGGCLNGTGRAARLLTSGSRSLSLPAGSTADLRFGLSDATPLTFALLFSGDALAPDDPANPCFGLGSGVQTASLDGLDCTAGNQRRHGVRPTDGSGAVGSQLAAWGGEGPPAAGLASSGFVAGQRVFFQALYREDVALGCMRGLNSSQAVEIEVTP